MKNNKKLLSLILVSALCLCMTGCQNKSNQSVADDGKYHIVTSFYPMHILTMNLTKDIDSVTVTSMSDPNLGCIHDHTFSTEDLKKIENADVYIENGLELEVFNDKLKEVYPDMPIVEASENVTDYPMDDEEINGHVWSSIDDYILQIQNVSSKLQSLNPENKDKYAANERAYIEKLEQLKADYADSLSAIKGRKVLVLDETLPSLCIFAGLEQYEIHTDHEQEVLSAENLKSTIEEMNNNGVKSIFITKDSDRRNAEAIAKETGATIYELNSCMTGDVNEDAYLNYMKENFEIISEIK